MNNPPRGRPRELPLKTCLACGGDWFRVADYYEFLREESLGSFWPTWPELVGQITMGAKPLLVCLCGTPLAPEIGGIRGGRTHNLEISRLMASLQQGQERLKDSHDGNSVLAAAAQQLASGESMEALAARLKTVERAIGRRMRSGPGRPWQLPTRKPAAKGRDELVLALQKAGLTSRKAKTAISEFWKFIQAALCRGELVETPLGVFQVVGGRKPRKRRRWGQKQVLYRQPKKVYFRVSSELLAVCNLPTLEVPTPKEDSVAELNVPSNQLCCEKCGSAYFVEAEFRRYREQYSSGPGGDLSPVGKPIQALGCLCGHPILLGKLRRLSITREDYASFQKSFEAARQYRESAQPQAILARLSPRFASREEYDKLAERISNLEAILRLRLPESPQSPDAPAPGAAS